MSQLDEMKLHHLFDFTPSALDGFTQNSFSFAHATSQEVMQAAQEWFGGEPIAAANYVKHLRKNFNIPTWADEAKVSNVILGSEKVFKDASRIPWSGSQFAGRFEKVLEDFGARLSKIMSPNQPGLELLVGLHTLSDGTWILMLGEAWRENQSGKEFVYWYIDALNHTRHFHLKPHPSVQFFLPRLLQSAAFLSESSDPDACAVSISREAMFGVSGDAKAPQIAIHQQSNNHHAAIGFDDDGNGEFYFMWSPETVRYGYIFHEVEDISHYEIAIAVATASLPKVAETLVDGFSNFHGAGSGGFQEITFADDYLYKAGAIEHFARGKFIAGPISQYIDFESYRLYEKVDEIQDTALAKRSADSLRLALNGYQEIISHGSGLAIAYSINRYVYAMQNYGGSILELSPEERAGFHDYGAQLLKYSTSLPVDFEDANAFSALALLEISRNKYQDALAAVNAGISILKQDRSHIPDSLMGDSNPLLNPHIKLELFATRAELLYRAGEVAKAKDLSKKILEEAISLEYEGPEIKKVKWILAH